MTNKPIYLDYNATTPIASEVAEAMLPFLYDLFGNPSSTHPYGLAAKEAVENARQQVCHLLNCRTNELIFTSGGTESNNHAIRGVASALRTKGNHIITSTIEHPAVAEVCRWLAGQGFEITFLPVDTFGMVHPVILKDAIRPETILVSIMHANNEVGTIQPISELAKITHQHGAIFHTDAAQSVGKVPVDVKSLGVDLLSVAGHKLYAPKGIGALYIRDKVELPNLLLGAGHEKGRRPGTENVLEIVGLGKACEIAARDLDEIGKHFTRVRDQLHQGILTELGNENVRLNGHPEKRLLNTLSLSFRSVAANTLLAEISQRVAASAGSACHADQVTISAVLEAMKVPLEWAMGTVRFSVGRGTTPEDIQHAIPIIVQAVHSQQKLSFLPLS